MAALGMIEVFGFATSIVVADAVAKAADVEVVAIDRNKPANADKCEVPLVMVVKFEGTPAAVQAAHDAGVAEAEKRVGCSSPPRSIRGFPRMWSGSLT